MLWCYIDQDLEGRLNSEKQQNRDVLQGSSSESKDSSIMVSLVLCKLFLTLLVG